MSDSDTPILGPINAPSMAYQPQAVTPLCEAAKDFLLFARVQGIRFTHLEVTDKGVLMSGIEDDYPSKRQTAATVPARPPSYMDDPNDP